MAKKRQLKPKCKEYEKKNGFVYVVRLWIGDKSVVKIGTTNRSVLKRVMEIAEEMYKLIGYIPKMKVIREEQTRFNYEVEAEVLKKSMEYKCSLGIGRWNGESEIRDMNDEMVCNMYDRCIAKGYDAKKMYTIEI